MPTALVVVAWIFIIEGIAAIVPTARLLLVEHRIDLNVSLLGLWIGPGLLRGQALYRRWALFVLRLGLALGVIVFLVVLLSPSVPPIIVFHGSLGVLSRGYLLAVIGFVLTGAVWQLRVLQRPDVRVLFENPLSKLPPKG
jgi:hypothetical protein